MSTYSFMNVTATIDGPGGSFNLGYGEAVADEGISLVRNSDKNTMTIGAGGEGMHSLHAARDGTVTVRLLKTAPANQLLMDMYNFQTSSAANHGQNTFLVRDVARNDVHTAQQAAFKKIPDLKYAKDGDILEWMFDAIQIDSHLGSGT